MWIYICSNTRPTIDEAYGLLDNGQLKIEKVDDTTLLIAIMGVIVRVSFPEEFPDTIKREVLKKPFFMSNGMVDEQIKQGLRAKGI